MTDKFASDTTLWRILRKFESGAGANLNFTGRGIAQTENGASGAGRILYEQPVMNVMGRECSTFGDLQKTLAQLGLNSGSGLIRLTFKKTESPIEEAIAEIKQHFKEEEEEAQAETDKPGPAGEASSEPDAVTAAIAKLPSDESSIVDMEDTSEASAADPPPYPEPVGDAPFTAPHTSPKQSLSNGPEETILGPGQRQIHVYSAPSGDTPKAALQPYNEADYEPTIAHAKLHQRRLQDSSHNKRLLSYTEEEQAEQEKAARLSKTKEVTIAIRFPDQSRVEGVFNAADTAAALYAFARGVITAANEPFRLVWNNPRPAIVPDDETKKLIKDCGFQGKCLVNFNWDEGVDDNTRSGLVLKPEFAQEAKEMQVLEPKATKEEEVPAAVDKGKGKETSGGGGKGKGVPKWFKGFKK